MSGWTGVGERKMIRYDGRMELENMSKSNG